MIDLRQTPEYAQYMKTLGWKVALVNNESGIRNYVYIKKIPLVGNIAKIQRPAVLPTPEQISTLRRKYTLAALYVEPMIPNSSFTTPGFDYSRTCFLPPKTMRIDLRHPQQTIFNQMKSKTRYNVRLAQKRGIVVKQSINFDTFIRLWQSSAKTRGMWLSSKKEISALWNNFGSKAQLLLAFRKRDGSSCDPIAGVFLLNLESGAAYYMYAASTREGNKLFAPTLLVWKAIKLTKKKGCKVFDFEGVYDKRYPQTKSWKGFSRFKEGFGGKVIEHPRTLVKYYNPLLKILRL